jgi:hypothetical protein
MGVAEDLFCQALGLDRSWHVMSIAFDRGDQQLNLFLAFPQGLNSLIQAARAKARGYRTSRNFITMIYLRTGKFNFSRTGLPT